MQVSSDHEIEKEEDEEMHLTDKPVYYMLSFLSFSNDIYTKVLDLFNT